MFFSVATKPGGFTLCSINQMKTLFVTMLALLAILRASGQVSLDLSLDQDEFFAERTFFGWRGEKSPTTSGQQQLHLGVDPHIG